MRKINEDLKKRSHEVLPPPSVAVTMIQGYEKDNVVPEMYGCSRTSGFCRE